MGHPPVKRIVVWLMEVLTEAFLLGTLLGALLFPNFTSLISGVWALAFAVGVVLFLHWYYLTRALFGVAWRSQRPWVYPAIAATLFVTHMHIAVVRSKSDLTPFAQATELPFLAGGACIVFACTFVGGWLLRKWTQAGSNGPERQHRGIVPGGAGV
jgi:uncharacterized membrane-anchored protein